MAGVRHGRCTSPRPPWLTTLPCAGYPLTPRADLQGVRVLRVARLFRLLKMRSLMTLFQALLLSLPAVWNVGGVAAIFNFAFAVAAGYGYCHALIVEHALLCMHCRHAFHYATA